MIVIEVSTIVDNRPFQGLRCLWRVCCSTSKMEDLSLFHVRFSKKIIAGW